jgi:hypothetical protein
LPEHGLLRQRLAQPDLRIQTLPISAADQQGHRQLLLHLNRNRIRQIGVEPEP